MSDENNSSSGSNFLANFVNGGIDSFYNYIDSWTGDFFSKRSEKRAYERALEMLRKNYVYARRYAENSPSWAVKGLRDAGLNPILAAGGSVHMGNAPSMPSVSPSSVGRGSRSGGRYWDPLLNKQVESISLDNELKEDNLKTVKAENEVRRLKAKAEADILKPELRLRGEPKDGKQIDIYVPSQGFRALQKAIRDDYDLRSEKYMRETIDSVMKYGTDVLNLLPMFRRKEILDTLQKTIKKGPNGKVTTTETYTTHSPR